MRIQITIEATPDEAHEIFNRVVPDILLPDKPFVDLTVKDIESRMFNLARLKGSKKVGEMIQQKMPSKVTT